MPTIHINGTKLWYEDTGGSALAILFSHGLLLESGDSTAGDGAAEIVIAALHMTTAAKVGAHHLSCGASILKSSRPTRSH